MKAIRVKEFGGPEKLQLEEVPNPKPGPGQVVVKIEAAGVNPVDVYIRASRHFPTRRGPTAPERFFRSAKALTAWRPERECIQQAVLAAPMRSKLFAKLGPFSRSLPMLGSRKAPRCMFLTAPPIAHYSRKRRLFPQKLC